MKLTARCENDFSVLAKTPCSGLSPFAQAVMVSTALPVTEWKYKGVCDEGRLRAVETSAPFEDIARRLEVDMEIVCCHARDCCDKPGYKRTIYCVRVAPMKRSTSCQIARTSPWLWAMIQPP